MWRADRAIGAGNGRSGGPGPAKPGGGGRLALAGALATAVAFGPARNGYGLFLPWLREEFGLSIGLAGLIASGGYAGYMLALFAVGLLAARLGPRPLVVAGTLSAALGMMLVALSPNVWALAAGVALAASSAGWSWSPYNDAAKRLVAAWLRPRVLSVVSTGTTFGIAGAGVTALVIGESWRLAWVAFSVAAVLALACNAVALPGKDNKDVAGDGEAGTVQPGLRWVFRAGAAPLFVVASSFGVVSSIYYSFAVDHVSRNGDLVLPLDTPLGPFLFVVLGAAGMAGFFTGDAMNRFGLGRVLATILFAAAAATILLGVAPGSWAAATVSAVMFGAYVMTISALLSVWSSLVFPERPSAGFSVALGSFAVGSILAPVSMGFVAGAYGYGVVFLISGAIATLTMLVRPEKQRGKSR